MALDAVIVEYRLELDQLRKDLSEVRKDVGGIDKQAAVSAEKSTKELNKIGDVVRGKVSSSFTALGGVIAGVFAIERIGSFITSSIKLATVVEEVKGVFDKINDPKLLENLRKDVKGTVSDLELMKLAISANNFKIPLEDLGKLLNFARLKADEGKGSFEQLSASIIESVGRNSARALVQLGIGQEAINEKVKETGSLYKGMTAIIDTELAKAGEDILSTADKQDRLNASIANSKAAIGAAFLPVIDDILTGIHEAIEGFKLLTDGMTRAQKEQKDAVENMISRGGFTDEQYAALVKKTEASLKTQKDIIDGTTKASEGSRQTAKKELLIYEARLEALRAYNPAVESSKKLVREMQDITNAANAIQQRQNELNVEGTITLEDLARQREKNAIQAAKELSGAKALNKELDDMFLIMLGRELDLPTEPVETVTRSVEELAETLLDSQENSIKLKDAIVILGDELSDEEKFQKAIDMWDAYGSAVFSIFHSITDAFEQGSDYREDLLNAELEAGRISQGQYDKDIAKIRRKEAIRDKALAVFQIAVNTPSAVMKALASGNPALAILAAIAGAIQLGTALSVEIPAFKHGVIDLQGAGTGTSDSIPARLSKGETVMTAKETREYKPVLKAIRKGNFEEYIYSNYLKKIELQRQKKQTEYDDYRIYLALNKGQHLDRKNTDRIIDALQKNQHRF